MERGYIRGTAPAPIVVSPSHAEEIKEAQKYQDEYGRKWRHPLALSNIGYVEAAVQCLAEGETEIVAKHFLAPGFVTIHELETDKETRDVLLKIVTG